VPHKAIATVIINGKNGYTALLADTNPNCANLYGNSTAYPSGGTAPYTYSWNNGETSQTATGLSAGSYTCTITDNTGCKCFVIADISVYVPPGIGVAPYNDSSCGPPDAQLHVYGLNSGVYNWAPHTGLSCYSCPSPIATPTVTTTYTISGKDTNGCSASTTITLTVLSVPKVAVKGKDSICSGYQDTLIVTGGSTYVWANNGATTDSIFVSPVSNQTYTVTASNGFCPSHDTIFTVYVLPASAAKITASKDSVCLGDSVELTASGAVLYKWSTGSTATSIWVKSPVAKTYTLYASIPGGCSDSATQLIKTIPGITASINPTQDTVCPNTPVTITVAGTGGQVVAYRWSNGATTSFINVNDSVTTMYTATVYGICDSMQETMTVTVIPSVIPVIKGTNWKCAGVDDTLTVSSSGNPVKYVWDNGATSTSIITGNINNDTLIYVTAYNSFGCPAKDTLRITVKMPPGVSLNPSTISCSGNPVLLTADASGTGPFTYTWSPGGKTTDTINVNPDTTTFYSVKVSNGCMVTKTTTVVPDNPTLSACCDHAILLGDDTVMVAHGSSNKPYTWSPSVTCLNPPLCDSVQVSPNVTTTYTVTLTDSSGCQLERIVTIIVEQRCFDFIVPNVFTPTNSGILGLNNVFYIRTQHLDSWSIIVYDRWGKEMYKSTDPNQYWDGNTEGGSKAPAGVYYYIINGVCQGNTYKKDGFVQLIR
jgi:gliding motility-associated-like protein